MRHKLIRLFFFRQLTHDPRTYANPMTFEPARFIASEGSSPEPDPRELCFGFGRRYIFLCHLFTLYGNSRCVILPESVQVPADL